MKNKTLFVLLIVFSFTIGMAGVGFSVHVEGKGEVKGTVTEIKIVEVELTVKDDKGTETKVKTKDTGAFKLGDRVVIKDAKVAKEVKPITGGY
jgi:outer membrane lipoprotein SlyB